MHSSTEKTDSYLAFLRFCLDESAAVPPCVVAIDWSAFYEFCKEQSIVGIVFHGIERIDASLRPDDKLLFRWYSITEKARKANLVVDHEAVKVSRRFEAAGFCTCLLKGQGNALLYPSPRARVSGDIDLWVYPRSLKPVQLEEAKATTFKFVRTIDPKAVPQYHHIDCRLGTKTLIEIHFTPTFANAPWHDKRMQRYFEEEAPRQFAHAVDLPEGIGQINVPTNDFNRIFLLSHIMHHFFLEGIGLRQFVDYYYLLRQGLGDKEERRRERQLLRHLGMERFASAVMYVMHDALGLDTKYLLVPPNEKLGKYLVDEIMASGNFGKADARYSFLGHNNIVLFFILTARVLKSAWAYPAESLARPCFLLWHQWWKWNFKRKIK